MYKQPFRYLKTISFSSKLIIPFYLQISLTFTKFTNTARGPLSVSSEVNDPQSPKHPSSRHMVTENRYEVINSFVFQ